MHFLDENIFPIGKVPSRDVLVVCGNIREFDIFCSEKLLQYEKDGYTRYEGVQFVYPVNMDSIRGYRFSEIILYGTYYKREDLDLHIARTFYG